MLLLAILVTVLAQVTCHELVGVSYYFDSNFKDTFSGKNCGNTSEWTLVNYPYIRVDPPYEESSSAIIATNNSCTSSFPIIFLNGTLKLTVYIRTISKLSGVTVTVFDDQDDVITRFEYRRSSKYFVKGWCVISLPVRKQATGYIQLTGQSLNTELVVIDSLRYVPETIDLQNIDINEDKKLQKSSIDDRYVFKSYLSELDNDDDGSGEEDDDIDGSGDGYETDPSVTVEPDYTPDPETSREETEIIPETPDDSDEGFWNIFTITLVSVGGFVVVGTISVGSFYIGKNIGRNANPPLDLETLAESSVIRVPRVRSVFSESPSGFSRYS